MAVARDFLMYRALLLTIVLYPLFSESSVFAFRPPPTQEEIEDLTREIAAEPGNSRPLQYRGLDYAILGEKDKALADYKAAQKISPRQQYLVWSFGWALFDLGDYPSAVQVWESVATQEREKRKIGYGWVFYTLALGHWAEGDKQQAFIFYTSAAKVDARLQDRDTFEAETDHWTQKEQTMGLQMFDAWQKEVERPGSHLW